MERASLLLSYECLAIVSASDQRGTERLRWLYRNLAPKAIAAFMTALRDDVTADRRFELVPSSCAPNCPTDGRALRDRLRAASQAGAQILIIGIVHKLSTLVQIARIAAIDTTAQRVVFRKYFQFRGDNDEAWQRAERFVSEEIRDRLLESRSQQ